MSQSGKRDHAEAFPDAKQRRDKPRKKNKRSRPKAATGTTVTEDARSQADKPPVVPSAALEGKQPNGLRTSHTAEDVRPVNGIANEEREPKKSRSSIRRASKHKKAGPKPPNQDDDTGLNEKQQSQAVIPINKAEGTPKKKQKHKHKHEHDGTSHDRSLSKLRQANPDSPAWELSSRSGGVFIDQDPLLTRDGEHLILCTQTSTHIYSTRTSLVVRSIPSSNIDITSATLSSDHGHVLFVAYDNGTLRKYDWTNGKCLWTVKMKGKVSLVANHSATKHGNDELLCIKSAKTEHSEIVEIEVDSHGNVVREHSILDRPSLYGPMKVFGDHSIVVACSCSHIFIGQAVSDADEDKDGTQYNWQEISLPGRIACFDAQMSKTTGSKSKWPPLNIAIGLKSGVIEIYDNILKKLNRSGQKDSATTALIARKEHWHRQQPNSLKFSPDGNYLVSGGEETTLMIMKLDSSNRQFLPHLASTILNIAISESGSEYAVHLADNSVMVLSTADLKPSANVSGLACDISPYAASATADRAVIHPTQPNTLLLASSAEATQPAPNPSTFLQSYDTNAHLQLNRQALSRTLVTAVKVGPNGQPLLEPNVTHIDVAHDGKWLITVDQWQPDAKSLRDLYLESGDESNRISKSECHLRFWSSASSSEQDSGPASNAQWQLNTRIDDAFGATDGPNPSDVPPLLALAASPSRLQVATADSSSRLKIFSPKARLRSGLPVLDSNSQPLYTWTCDRSIPLSYSLVSQSTKTRPSLPTKHAALAYSEDGSVLATCWSSASDEVIRVHLIDPKTGTVHYSLENIVLRGKTTLRFCGRYLCALSSKFVILDTISMEIVFEIDLWEEYDTRRSILDANTASKTVALAMNPRDVTSPGRLVVYSLENAGQGAILDCEVKAQVRILRPDKGTGGFVIVDGRAALRKALPASLPMGTSHALVPAGTQDNISNKAMVRGGINELLSLRKKSVVEEANPPSEQRLLEDSSTSTLEDLLRFENTARAPAPSDLFAQVARLIAGTTA